MVSGERISSATEARRILIAANPHAGARSGQLLVGQVADGLRQRGFAVEIISDIAHLIREVQGGYEDGSLYAVAAAGGDGTAALVVNVLPPSVPLALIPLGTENLFAKYLGVKADADAICESIAGGSVVRLDAGKANDRLFLLMLGCGFDAEVVRRLHRERKGHIHHFSYAKPILDSIRSYEYPQLRVYFQPASPTASVAETGMLVGCWAFVVNLPRYAGGLSIVPGADGSDGLLDVGTFKHGNLWNGLMYLGGVWLGQHGSWRDFATVRAPRIRIEADAPDVPYQLDGDPGGVLPVEVEALPGRITVLTPPRWVPRSARNQPLAKRA
jgi:diacylglycerol kinase family enzyme